MNGGRQKINSYSEYRCPKVTPFREAEAAERYYKQNRKSKRLAGTRTSSGASPASLSPRSSSLSSASLEFEKLSLSKTDEGRGQPGFRASDTRKASPSGGHDQAAVPADNSSSEKNSTRGSAEPEFSSAPSPPPPPPPPPRDVVEDGGPNKGKSPPSFKAIPSFPSSSRMDDLRALVGFPSDLCDENDEERKMRKAYEEGELMARRLYGTDGDGEEEEDETTGGGGRVGDFDRISELLHQMRQADADRRQKVLKRFEAFEALKQARKGGE